ncbi:hypothetical protein ESY86_05750 [Subsaximicrobium wynnwilliamsii]|uniref:Uncharacterized protein n=1 Tax=Subsaximicrobium wynnwilliamsii TaxID=291179 RepID=A0A5C6ZLV6_9FLAO|nr:multicopper oxidase domain-containing protein [Subsaximicrobium wynnwilliamsii]TXD84559.1 hypothetical protein ESY87_05525 [Subsaximicrobium wynnwilliamsii]TXD90241.1 hypothetical protein ESY86_05750 [Subsaximicrobium wynnwilliamsii]TXE04292.1 hypothetical protein ESY88_05520 [Subsaximicrobium wynnwilliamsii]
MKSQLWLLATLLILSIKQSYAHCSTNELAIREHILKAEKQSGTKTDNYNASRTLYRSIPNPTLALNEDEQAVVYVTNRLAVAASVHWRVVCYPSFVGIGTPSADCPKFIFYSKRESLSVPAQRMCYQKRSYNAM